MRKKSGFTLIEIIMALFIIGLLAAIILPNYISQKEQAKIAQTKANLETLRSAIAMFYEEEGQWPQNDLSDLMSAPSGLAYITAIPQEAFNNDTQVVNSPDYSGGWWWDNSGFQLYMNVSGQDANGDDITMY